MTHGDWAFLTIFMLNSVLLFVIIYVLFIKVNNIPNYFSLSLQHNVHSTFRAVRE